MKKIFYFLAKKISYTFSVCLFVVFGFWLSATFGYFLGIAFLTSANYDAIYNDIMKWYPISILITSLLYYVQCGLLTPIKIPALARSLRQINRSFSGDKLNELNDDEELNLLFEDISFLPAYNMIGAVLFAAITVLLMFGLISFDHVMSGTFSYDIVKEIIRVGLIGFGVTAVISGMTSYLSTDILTGRERTVCYNELRRRGYNIPPITYIRLGVKLSFFLILLIISLLTFGALIERGRYYGETDNTLIVVYFVLTVFACFILMYINASSILRIFADIRRVAKEITSGGEGEFRVLPMEREFADIEYTIMEMKRELEEHKKDMELSVEERTTELQNALSDLKERDDLVQKQLDMASTIQRGILPGRIDDWNGLKFSARYLAMEKIGGDFYDVYQLGGNKLSLLIADVSGHGIPAALVTAMAKISFGNAHLKYDSPRMIFQDVNQDMLDHVKTQDYLTCFILVIDDDYNVTYANASHQKGMLLRTGEAKIELLDTGGLFIGAIEDASDTYEEKEVKLNFGDRIILYTDGIPEAVNDEKKEYTNERLEEVVIKNRELPLEDFTDFIIEDLQRFMGRSVIQDDVTLLVVELEQDETIEIIKRVKYLSKDNKFYEAIDQLQNGLTLYPDNEKILYNLAKSYFRVNEFEKVVEYINRYLETNKNNKYAYYIGGTAYFQMIDYDNANQFYDQALKLDPNFVNALFASGMVHKKSGSLDDAARCFEKVVDIDGTNQRALYELNELKSSDSV